MPALQLRDALLEHVARRVHDAGVDVAEHSQPEEVGGVLRVVEHVARRGVDRHGARVGGRVGRLAGVDRQGVGLVGHAALLEVWENVEARTAPWSGPGLGCRVAGVMSCRFRAHAPMTPSTPSGEDRASFDSTSRGASMRVPVRGGETRRPPAWCARRAIIRRFSSLVRPPDAGGPAGASGPKSTAVTLRLAAAGGLSSAGAGVILPASADTERVFHSLAAAHGQQSLVRHLDRRRPAGGRQRGQSGAEGRSPSATTSKAPTAPSSSTVPRRRSVWPRTTSSGWKRWWMCCRPG